MSKVGTVMSIPADAHATSCTAAVGIADRPAVAYVATLVVTVTVYAAYQLAFDGQVNVLEAGAFAALLMGLASLRERLGKLTTEAVRRPITGTGRQSTAGTPPALRRCRGARSEFV